MTIQAATQAVSRIDTSMYIKELFDPVQTHAVYGVNVAIADEVKFALKQAGATRFRIVNANMKGLKIVCFKMK